MKLKKFLSLCLALLMLLGATCVLSSCDIGDLLGVLNELESNGQLDDLPTGDLDGKPNFDVESFIEWESKNDKEPEPDKDSESAPKVEVESESESESESIDTSFHMDANGYWWIDGRNTGLHSSQYQPYAGNNGNWWVGPFDTGIPHYNQGDNEGESENESESESESESKPKQDIVTEDFSIGGLSREFTMMVRPNRYHYLYAENDSTDRVAQGTFMRNISVEIDYGIKIKIYKPSGANESNAFIDALAGSTGEYDLCVPDYWWHFEQQGFLLNLLTRDELDFSKDYWYDEWNKNTTINNRLYTVVGDASLEILENIEVIYFNKAMTNSLGLDMYKLVNDKEWTLDQMNDIGKQFAGGSETTDTSDDTYGLVTDTHSRISMMYSSGIKLAEIGENGSISLVAQSRTLNGDIHAKLKEIFNSSDNYWDDSTARSNLNTKTNLFVNGKTAFYANCLYAGSNITQSASDDFEFGILPAPLYAEGNDYISTSYSASVFAIPISCIDQHFSAVILNALNYYSEDTVVDGFYKKLVGDMFAENSDDAKMLDLARNSLYFDFAWIFDMGGKMTLHSTFQSALAENKDLSSTLPTAMEVSELGLGEIMAFYTRD